MWDWFCFGIQLYIVVHFYIFGINLKCIRLGLGRLRGDEQTAVGSRNKNKREEAQYHHRRLITLEHSIINCVSRPPGLFTWDWEVFALGLTDWLCRPSAASSPQLRFVFCFFSPPSSSSFLFIMSRVSDLFHTDYPSRWGTVSVAYTCRNTSTCVIHSCDKQQVTDTKTVVFWRLWWNSTALTIAPHQDDGPFPRSFYMYVKNVLVCFK